MSMSTHHCGSCTLCCTVMRVAMDPPKPEHVTCRHCSAKGCGIYQDRPEVCSSFQCLWLASQQIPGLALPPAMRPDRVGVAIDLNGAGTVIAHCERPGSWRREPIRSWLLKYAGKTNVMLETPLGAELLASNGTTERLERIGVDAQSNNRLYVRASELHLLEDRSAA